MNTRALCTVGMAWMLGGCSLIPEYQRPAAPTPAQYPQDGVYRLAQAGTQAQNPDWQQLFRDPALQQLINDALLNNRDLRVAALNVQAFQAQYRIQRADLFPAISATGAGKRQKLPGSVTGTGKSAITSNYSATLGLSAYELDLFGRVRSLSEQALLTYLGTEQARRSTQLSLVANVANAYLTWRADQELLALAEQTLVANDHSWQLTSRSKSAGKASALDVVQARTAVESTRASVARYERQVAQDLNNLTLLVGGPVDEHLPARPLADDLVARVPAGLPSDLLQRRPDILQAEYQLQAANARIGAARAMYFPRIALTALGGTASAELDGLFTAGSRAWTFAPSIALPLFDGGRRKANVQLSEVQREQAVNHYQRTIEAAFRDVADALAANQWLDTQLHSLQATEATLTERARLARRRYDAGATRYFEVLDAERDLLAAQQQVVQAERALHSARLQLYTALGGGSAQLPPPTAD